MPARGDSQENNVPSPQAYLRFAGGHGRCAITGRCEKLRPFGCGSMREVLRTSRPRLHRELNSDRLAKAGDIRLTGKTRREKSDDSAVQERDLNL